MNLNNLINEVYALGFEAQGGMNELIVNAANRALRQIFCDLPLERSIRLLANIPKHTVVCDSFAHAPAEQREFTLNGLAFSFKVSGEGEATVTDENGVRSYSFNTPYGIVRDFISGSATIAFLGAFRYTVTNLVCFEEITSADREKIFSADGHYTIKMSDISDDFFFFSRQPVGADMSPIPGAVIEGDTVLIPISHKGEITVYYNRAPRACDVDSLTQDIDIPECLCHLLPLLVASFVWLEDDADRAAYYASLYREGIMRIKNAARGSINTAYNDVLRWA